MATVYKITISYRGSDHFGWQIQPDRRTLQQELNQALIKVAKSDEIRTLASGRTDTGVHAMGQVVRVDFPFYIEPQGLKNAINANVNDALRVLHVEVVDDRFHPISDAKAKEYRYFFCKDSVNSLFLPSQVVTSSFSFNLKQMDEAAQCFVGRHDFYNFHTLGSEPHTTVRQVLEAEVFELRGEKELPWSSEEYFCFRVKGKGFLKQMVRSMMGAVWAVGRDHSTISDLCAVLKREEDRRVGAVAPPDGLYLWKVWY